MNGMRDVNIRFANGLEIDEKSIACNYLKTGIAKLVNQYLEDEKIESIGISISVGDPNPVSKPIEAIGGGTSGKINQQSGEFEKRMAQYVAVTPTYRFDRLVVNDSILEDLMRSVHLIENYEKIYVEWGLRQNSPYTVVALNFLGPSGTGKTLAAHAIADHLKKRIILASYAQIESMWHGEGPKNVEAIFRAAELQDAVLFIDEADSLLSKRLTNVREGNGNAINSMRSQILICLEKFSGIVIFATNLISNYDRAFESRVRSIKFDMPDKKCRLAIWKKHLPSTFPLSSDVTPEKLSEIDDISGREIRNAVLYVAETMALKGLQKATFDLFRKGITRIKESRFDNCSGEVQVRPLTIGQKEAVSNALSKAGILPHKES